MLPLERRKWFQLVICVAALLCTFGSALAVRLALPAQAAFAQFALVLLCIGAVGGFITLFEKFLPLLLLKLWPALEKA